jgi:hypothetical protein
MAGALERRDASDDGVVGVGQRRGGTAGGKGRDVELVIGGEDERRAQQRARRRPEPPGRRQHGIDRPRRRLAPRHRRGEEPQDPHAALRHRRRREIQGADIARRRHRQEREAALDRRKARHRAPGSGERRRLRRQVVGGEDRGALRLPEQRRDAADRGVARQEARILATVVEPVVEDQGDGGLQHGRAEAQRRLGDEPGIAVAASAQALDILRVVAPLPPAGAFRADEAAAHIGIERLRPHPERRRRRLCREIGRIACHLAYRVRFIVMPGLVPRVSGPVLRCVSGIFVRKHPPYSSSPGSSRP